MKDIIKFNRHKDSADDLPDDGKPLHSAYLASSHEFDGQGEESSVEKILLGG